MLNLNNLKIYNKSLDLVVKIYNLIKDNSILAKDFSLCDQIKRAVVSIPTNIAEGYFRSIKQTSNYLEIASGSTNEVITILKIIQKVYQINTTQLQEEFIYLGKQINSFVKSI